MSAQTTDDVATPEADRTDAWRRRAEERPLAGERIPVVGGGIGGLATACYLAAAGAEVRVIERGDRLGGAATRIEAGPFTFDAGPSWYLMPDVFERFFDHFGTSPDEFYRRSRPSASGLDSEGDGRTLG